MTMRATIFAFLLVASFSLRCSAEDKPGWVERPVDEAGIRGIAFLHEGPPRPTMLVLGGAEGGMEGSRSIAGHLADLGYNALVFAYFGLPGVRPQLVRVPLEDFSRAIDWLHQQPFVGARPVGILGCSKGAEAALLVGCMRADLGVVVTYVPTHVVWECIDEQHGSLASSWTRDGAELPFVPYKRLRPTDVDSNWGWDCLRDLHVASIVLSAPEALERAEIPVEKIRAPLLLFSGERDLVWPSFTYAKAIEARLKRLKSAIPFRHVSYPEAGHSFISGSSENGGTENANRAAQKDSQRVLEMFLPLHFPLR